MTRKSSSPYINHHQGRRINATLAEVATTTIDVYRPVLAGDKAATDLSLIQNYVKAVLDERGYDARAAQMFAINALKVALRPPIVTRSGRVLHAARSINDPYSATYDELETSQPSVYSSLESVIPAKGVISLAAQGSAVLYLFIHPRLRREQQAINNALGVAGDDIYTPGLSLGEFPRVDARTADMLAGGLTEISKLATVDLGPVALNIN